MTYRNIILAVLAFVLTVPSFAASLKFSGNDKAPITENTDKSSGLDALYVLFSANGVTASCQCSSSAPVVYRFGNAGGAYAEEITSTLNGGEVSFTLNADDCGYIVEDGTTRYYFWIVNYANHYAQINALTINAEQECDRARLQFDGNAKKIAYHTITGAARELSRDLQLAYTTLAYSAESDMYVSESKTESLAYADGIISSTAPLCSTDFILSGDRFLEAWGLGQEATSPYYEPIAVEAHTTATQEIRENDNEQKVETEGMGGSAPANIKFTAAVTDAAIFREWQIARDPEFELIDDRYQQLELDYTFRDNGTFYVRFVANNAQGTCEYIGDTYTVPIGESALLCPNAFSPGASEGVNDEWKVSYKSIIKFDCHIFNKWGQLMTSFTDPSQGWDGKYKGKYVPAGAYYYVITAEGSDGRKYKLSGDINIVKSSSTPYGPSDEGTE